MTWAQERAYLAKKTAAERTAYLYEIGLAQRFQALDPLDQETVRYGWPRRGMSAEALLFVWGEPYYTAGDARRSAHWYYLGSSMELAAHGNQYQILGTASMSISWTGVWWVGSIILPATPGSKGGHRW